MTAQTRTDGETTHIKVSPSWATIIISVFTTVVLTVAWVQSQISDRPTREETTRIAREQVQASESKLAERLTAQQALLQMIYDKVEGRDK